MEAIRVSSGAEGVGGRGGLRGWSHASPKRDKRGLGLEGDGKVNLGMLTSI